MPAISPLDSLQIKTPSSDTPLWRLSAHLTANNKPYTALPMLCTPLGNVSGPLIPIANYGCDAIDFPPTINNNTFIALISRGECTYARKSLLALNAGASAALIYNNVAAYPLNGTLGVAGDFVPTLGITQAVGEGFHSLLTAGQNVTVSISITEIPPPQYPDAPVETCAHLSPKWRAFSTLLTAFVSSVITGLAAGFYAPCFSVLFVWLGPFRAAMLGIYQFVSACMALQHEPLIGQRKIIWSSLCRYSFYHRPDEPPAYPTFWGWVGWVYMACWSPVVQALWLAENVDRGRGSVVAARAVVVLAVAMPLTLESRLGYVLWLEKWVGCGTGIVFQFVTACATLVLSAIAAVEFVDAVSTGLLIVATCFGVPLTFATFLLGMPDDEGEPQTGWRRLLGGLAAGVLCAFVVGAPAIASFVNANDDGASLGEYLSCGTVNWWQKAAAVLP